ncbi:YwqJ-related putative deaminase [Paenibacillus sp. SYP-B4298]|uniref:YwqJ-related putative deaminase n=1 Tax=Paenibacillus sp. SYP-B4298 TaxID=2996034 RepID=UPI0022DD2CB9|nr:YwqJ-related putative deaminase [Paenibacillus sp. SYP-B4298]
MSEEQQPERALAGYGQLRLQGCGPVQQLQAIRLEQRIGEHARLWASGIIPQEQAQEAQQWMAGEEPVLLEELREEGQTAAILFQGYVVEQTIQARNEVYTFQLEAISSSSMLDRTRRIRPFAAPGQSYTGMIRQVLSAYPGGDTIDEASGGQQLGEFVVQYEETDWEFLSRMASRFGTWLVPEVRAASPKIWFGLPEGRAWELERGTTYKLRKTLGGLPQRRIEPSGDTEDAYLSRYEQRSNWKSGSPGGAVAGKDGLRGQEQGRDTARDVARDRAREEGYARGRAQSGSAVWQRYGGTAWATDDGDRPSSHQYVLESAERYALGDRIRLNEREWIVAGSESCMEAGLLRTRYNLCEPEGLVQPRYGNPRMIGGRLRGKVQQVQQDRVQVELDTESQAAAGRDAAEADKSKAASAGKSDKVEGSWFGYRTPYAGGGHTGWYSMPEPGDAVEILLPCAEEGAAYAVEHVRVKALGSDPEVKSWRHRGGAGIALEPERLLVEAGAGVQIRLDGSGLTVESSGELKLDGGHVRLTSGGRMKLEASEAVYLRGGASSVVLDGESDVRTPLLKQEGRTKKPVTVKPLPRVYEPPLMPMADYEAAQRAEQEAAAAAAGIGAVGAGAAGAGLLGVKAGSLLSAGLALVGMIPVIGGVLKGAMTAGLTALGMLPRTGAASIGAVVGMRAGAPSAGGSGGGVWSDLAALLIALKQGQPLDIGDVVTLARKIQQHWSWSELLRQLMEEMNRRSAARARWGPEETTKPVSTPGVADTLLIDPARLDDEDMINQAMKDHTEHLNGTYEIKSEIDLDIIELQMVSEGSKAYAKIRESLLKNSFRGDEAALERWMKRFKDPGTRGKAILELKQGIGLTREPTSAQSERNRAAEVYLVMSDVLRKDPSSGEYEGLKKDAIRWYQQLYPNKSKSEAEQWFARLTQSGGRASEEQVDEAWSEFWERYNEQQAANDQFWFGMMALADAVMSIRDVKNASRYGTMGLTSGGGTPPRPNANGSSPSKNTGTNPPPAAPKAKPEEPSSGTGNGKKDGGNSGKGGEGSKGSGSEGTGELVRNKGLANFTVEEISNLKNHVIEEAQMLKDIGLTNKQLGPAVAGVYDKTTGKIYTAINDVDGLVPKELHPIIKERIKNMPQGVKDSYTFTYGAGSHAEVYAANKALLANSNARIEDLIVYVIKPGSVTKPVKDVPFHTCAHCNYILKDFNIISDLP